MSQGLRILMIEDSDYDMRLILRELRKGDFEPVWERIQTKEELLVSLTSQAWDVILSDYTLPQFDAPTALEILKQHALDIPFIVVSGAIGERLAVDMMKAGAHDYVMKNNLTRLPEAVRRELRDVQVRAARLQSEQLLRQQLAAIEATIDGIAIYRNDNDVCIYVNRSHLELLGYHQPEDLVGKTWKYLFSPSEIERLEQEVIPIIVQNRTWRGECMATRKDGSTFQLGLSISLTEDDLLITVCRDITDLKQVQEKIVHNALHDPLTNLANRKLLVEGIEHSIERAYRTQNYQYAILFIDLDRFKVINDSLGHTIGDQLLQTVAESLVQHVRTVDLVARWGGDEFIILLEDISKPQSLMTIIDRIIEDFQNPIMIGVHKIFITFSIGIVLGSSAYQQAADLIRDADTAMYRAKVQKHSSFRFFDATMHAQAVERLTIETDLYKALEQKEFVVHYQPIVDMLGNKLYGFEALVRWQHPTRGLISPDVFIPVAEETGMIWALDTWVFRQACSQMGTWKKKFAHFARLNISINLSAQDFRNSSLIDNIDQILIDSGLAGNLITCEITESLLIDDSSQTVDALAQLADRHIKISIDDFGTGYSSLQYLHRLPVDYLKIDRSFVNKIKPEKQDYPVINTIIALGNQIDLQTIAEGIETRQQMQMLQQSGCCFGQGYYFAKPLSPLEIEERYGQSIAVH